MTTATVRAACALVAALLLPAAALAADAPAGGPKSVLEPNLVNSIVTVVVFGALLAILYTAAWGPIMKGLQAREAAQFQAIADAKRARDDAAALRSQLEAELARAAQQARAILDEARRDAEALKVAMTEEGARDAQAERERGKRDAALEKDAKRKELQQEVVELAMLIATKALRQEVTIDQQTKLLDESVAELKTRSPRA